MNIIMKSTIWTSLFQTKKITYRGGGFVKDAKLSFKDLLRKQLKQQQVIQSRNRIQTFKDHNRLIPTQIQHANLMQNIADQFPGLSLIQKMMKTSHSIPSINQQGRFLTQTLKNEQDQNSKTFMKYLDHSLAKEGCETIITLIQTFCKQRSIQQQEKINILLINTIKEQDRRRQSKLFEDVKLTLQKYLIHTEENAQNNLHFIRFIMETLSKSNPQLISNKQYKENFYLNQQLDLQPIDVSRKICGIQFLLQNQKSHYKQTNQSQKSQSFQSTTKTVLQDALYIRQKMKDQKFGLKKTNIMVKNTSQPRIKLVPQNMIFKKKQSKLGLNGEEKHRISSKYVYCYGLAFNISQQEIEEFITFMHESKGLKVKSYAFFPYKTIFEKAQHDLHFKIPDNFKQSSSKLQIVYQQVNIEKFVGKNTKQSSQKRPSRKSPHKKSPFDDVPLQNQPKRLTSITDALLLKIKRQSYSKFNKSTLILELQSQQQKKKLITQQSRLFGVNFKAMTNIKFEEGHSKKQLMVSEIPVGCTTAMLQEALNKILDPLNLSVDLGEKAYITKSYINIEFEHFIEVLQAMKTLNNLPFLAKKLKTQICYGPSKLFNSKYLPLIFQNEELLRKKIEETTLSYEKIYKNLVSN